MCWELPHSLQVQREHSNYAISKRGSVYSINTSLARVSQSTTRRDRTCWSSRRSRVIEECIREALAVPSSVYSEHRSSSVDLCSVQVRRAFGWGLAKGADVAACLRLGSVVTWAVVWPEAVAMRRRWRKSMELMYATCW